MFWPCAGDRPLPVPEPVVQQEGQWFPRAPQRCRQTKRQCYSEHPHLADSVHLSFSEELALRNEIVMITYMIRRIGSTKC